jgi:hypothetical protein
VSKGRADRLNKKTVSYPEWDALPRIFASLKTLYKIKLCQSGAIRVRMHSPDMSIISSGEAGISKQIIGVYKSDLETRKGKQ